MRELNVSFAELVVTGMKTVDGERFFVGRRVKGRNTEDDAETEECSFPPELPAPARAALEAVGITPYAPIGEVTLREKLGRLGLRELEIDSYFAESSEVDDPCINRVASAALMYERSAQQGAAGDVRNARA
jgi:hypothetical protein